jgi:hypothetical protein
MHGFPGSATTESARKRGDRRVLLLVGSAPLMLRMAETVRSIPGLQLVGSFTNPLDVVDWAMWDRDGWHLAYVDLTLAGSDEAVARLLAARRPGIVVGVVDHLWREVRQASAAIGVLHIVEKGDLIALRDDLEQRAK